MVRKEKILAEIKKIVKEIDSNADVILFGSRARGDENIDSDWDLLIIVPQSVTLRDEQIFRHRLFDLEIHFGQAISTIVKSKEEWNNKHKVTPLYENVLQEGVLL